MKKKCKAFARKAVSLVAASALVMSMTAIPAQAATVNAAAANVAAVNADGSMDTTGYVTAANTPASQPAPEILGITSVDELQIKTDDITGKGFDGVSWGTQLKYVLMADSTWNTSPNPFYHNTVVNKGQGVVFNTDHRKYGGKNGPANNPNSALGGYSESATDYDKTDADVWSMLPDIIIGNETDKTTGATKDYSADIEAIRADTNLSPALRSNYSPKVVPYDLTTMKTIVQNVYDLAKAADDTAASTNKKLRYGSAMAIAKNVEKYTKGIQGYILLQIANGKVKEKTVAVVSEKNTDGSYTLMEDPTSGFGTATRFAEIAMVVSKNLASELGKTTVSEKELLTADLIVFANATESTTISSDVAAKAFWYENENNGAIYKVTANAIEVGQNFGRVLGCLYPEVIDQSDLIAYYYDNFYHLNAGKLGEAIDKAMDGVRNWKVKSGGAGEMIKWAASDVANYNRATVQAKLDQGVGYLKYLGAKADSLVQLTDNLKDVTAVQPTPSTDQPSDKPADKPSDESTDKPADQPSSDESTAPAIGTTTDVSGATVQVTSSTEVAYTKAPKAKTVTIPKTVVVDGVTLKVTAIADNAFKGNTTVKKVIIPDNITTIGKNAFDGAKKLSTVTVSKNVKTIKANAFKGTKKLKTLTIKSSKLTKKSVKNALKGSSIKTIKVKVSGSKAAKKKIIKQYKKIFTKKNCGKKVTVK